MDVLTPYPMFIFGFIGITGIKLVRSNHSRKSLCLPLTGSCWVARGGDGADVGGAEMCALCCGAGGLELLGTQSSCGSWLMQVLAAAVSSNSIALVASILFTSLTVLNVVLVYNCRHHH
jgi:hypothetical protein